MSRKKKYNITVNFYTEEKKINSYHFAYRIMIQGILLLLSVLGTLGILMKALEIPVSHDKLMGISVFFIIVFIIIFTFFKWGKYALMFGGILYLFCIIRNINFVKEGCLAIINIYIKFYNKYMNLNLLGFHTGLPNEERIITMFLIFILIPFIGVLSYTIVRNRNHILYFIVTIPFIVIVLTIGKVPDPIYFGLFFISALGVLSTARIDNQKEYKKETDNYGQALIIIALLGVIMVFCVKFLPKEVYDTKLDVEEVKKTWQKTIEQTDISNLTAKFMLKNNAQGGIGEGRLGRIGSVKFKNNVMFEITMPLELHNLYLRSYVGSLYNSEGWSPASTSEIEQYRPMLDSLEEENFSSINQVTRFLDAIDYLSPYIRADITINDKAENEKYMKVPYFSTGLANVDSVQQEISPFENKQIPYLSNSYSGYFFTELDNMDGIYRGIISSYLLFEIYKKMIETIIEKPIEQFDQRDEDYYSHMTVNDVYQLYTEKYPWRDDVILLGNESLNYFIEKMIKYDTYVSQEKIYRDIVYKEYLTLPIDSCQELITEWKDKYYYKSFLGNIIGGNYIPVFPYDNTTENLNAPIELTTYNVKNHQFVSDKTSIHLVDIGDIIAYVKEYLDENTTYSLNPGSTPRGKDFIEYFLTENKLGYCSYYATAATIMFRSMGVPSRYVEGFVVTYNDIKYTSNKGTGFIENGNNNTGFEEVEGDFVTTEIRDRNAHAWTEIYIDGFGWIPVDVTPGYTRDGVTILPNEISNPQLDEDAADSNNLDTLNSNEIENNSIPPQNLVPEIKPELTPSSNNQETAQENEPIKRREEKDVFQENIFKFLVIIFSIMGTIIVLIGIILIRFKYLDWKKRKKLTGHDIPVKIGVYYKDIKYLIEYCGVKEKTLSDYTEYCREVEEKITFQEKGVFTEGIKVIIKSEFSEKGINEKELKKVEKCYNIIRKCIYFRVNKYQILKLKYLNIIYPIVWNDNSYTSNIK